MLTAEELAGMEETRESNLPDVANVVSIEYTRNSRGDAEEVAVTGPDIPARIAVLGQGPGGGGRESVVLERLGVTEAWKIVVPRGSAEIRLQDRLLIDVRRPGEGIGHTRLLEVVAAPGPRSYELAHAWVGIEIR